jgi:hypothetical protein
MWEEFTLFFCVVLRGLFHFSVWLAYLFWALVITYLGFLLMSLPKLRRILSMVDCISFDELSAAAQLVWSDKRVAGQIALGSYSILNSVRKRRITFYSGRRAKALVGGLFYLLGFRFDAVKKQNELADVLGITDVTIRLSYRRWLIEFTDLFVDVIGKLAQDESLKYFVLIDLKQAKKSV